MKIRKCLILLTSLLLLGCSNSPVTPKCNHIDNNHDHTCDNCGVKVSEHVDNNLDHNCDICSYVMSSCEDKDNNHKCDTCNKTISDHIDNDKNHHCDICSTSMGEHKDTNNDHLCEYCGSKVSDHKDDNHDHSCDICEEVISTCIDNNKDDKCDICGKNMNFKIYVTNKDNEYSITSGVELTSDPYETPEIYKASILVEENTQILIQDNLHVEYKSYKTDIESTSDCFATSVVTINPNNNHLIFHVFGTVMVSYDSSKTTNNITVSIVKVTPYQTCEHISGSSSYVYESLVFDPSIGKTNKLQYSLHNTTYCFTINQYFQIRANKSSKNLKHFTLSESTNKTWFTIEEDSTSTCMRFHGNENYYFSITVLIDITTNSIVVDFTKIGSK